MKAILLSRKLDLEAPQMVADGAGGFSRVWVSLGQVWAEVLAGTGREAAGEEVVVASVMYRITVRAAPFGSASRPKPDQRLRDGARVFNILAVSERDAQGLYLTCTAREEQPT
ncbi:MAG: head-tail adaptor protein [Cypionkella sp.]